MAKPRGPEASKGPETFRKGPDVALKKIIESVKGAKNKEALKVDLNRQRENLRVVLEEKASPSNRGARKIARAQLKVVELKGVALDNPKLSTGEIVDKYKKIVKKRTEMISRITGL